MSWKRFLRAAVCLLVVCCLILNMSPLRANASVITATVIGVTAVCVVAAVLIGLGVMPGSTTSVFDDLVDDCVAHLTGLGLIADGICDVVFFHDTSGFYTVKEGLVTAVVQWLYDSETVTQSTLLSTSGFSVSSVSAVAATSYGPLAYNDSRFIDTLKSAFENQLAIVAACSSSYLVGLYWGTDGLLYKGTWDNPMGSVHSSLLGCYDLSSLSLVDSKLYCVCYYSKYYAELNEDWLTSSYFAFDFDDLSQFSLKSYYGSFYIQSPVFVKSSTNSIWNTSKSDGSYYWSWQANSYSDLITTSLYYPTGKDYVTWEDSSTTSITVSDGLSQGEIALQEESLEVGYSDWYSNSSITDADGEETRVYPFPYSGTLSDYYTVSQSDVWAGTMTGADVDSGTDTGAVAGTVAGTALGEFLESLVDAITAPFEWLADKLLTGIQAVFVPSEDFITAKVESLRANYAFADSIMDTGSAIGAALNDFETEPPIIYMELSNAESQYDWGDRAIALDLRWYERYKPTVDTLLSALLWIFFAWRVFRKLPGIISGMEGDTPFAPVSDGRFSFRGYASDVPRLGSGSLKRRD